MKGRREAVPEKKGTTSQRIALYTLELDAVVTFVVLGHCGVSIWRGYEGALPYLTTLIASLQAVTGVVLGAYFNKSKAENTKGGIVYDTALTGNPGESEGVV